MKERRRVGRKEDRGRRWRRGRFCFGKVVFGRDFGGKRVLMELSWVRGKTTSFCLCLSSKPFSSLAHNVSTFGKLPCKMLAYKKLADDPDPLPTPLLSHIFSNQYHQCPLFSTSTTIISESNRQQGRSQDYESGEAKV